MNILITGVNGLVGNTIAEVLSLNHHVIGVSRSPNKKSNLKIEYYSIDISNLTQFENLAEKKIEIIIHCAASLDQSNSEELINSNCMGVRNIAVFAEQIKCKQVIYISGITVIGKPISLPITEEHLINPISIYHSTKYFGEIFLSNFLKNTKVAILRVPSPIGSSMPSNKILPFFIQKCLKNENIQLLGNGNRVQNYIDVRDLANATQLVIQNGAQGIFNIASENSISNMHLAELCIKLFQSQSKISYSGFDAEEDHKWFISIEKAKKDLGFYPSISLEESILEIAKQYQT